MLSFYAIFNKHGVPTSRAHDSEKPHTTKLGYDFFPMEKNYVYMCNPATQGT